MGTRYRGGRQNWRGSVAEAPAAASEYAPGRPLQLDAGAIGVDSIELIVTAPYVDATHGVATDYVYQRALSGSISWTTISDSVSADTSYIVTGLSAGTAYDFRVAAKNSVGTSANFTMFDVSTLAAAGTVTLEWAQRRDDAGAAITTDGFVIYSGQTLGGAYTVVATIANGSLVSSSSPSGEVTYSYTITGLSAGDWYFGIATVDAIGNESDIGLEIHKVLA